jgi:hypothetical protein
VVRDSAGIQIVENGRIKELPAAFVIAPTPRLDLGGAKDSPEKELDPRSPFLNVSRLSDGRLAVSDMSSVKVFDAGGQYLSTIGRPGNGPGEFSQLRSICIAPGDTIIAIADGAPGVNVFDSRGELVRTFSVKDAYVEGSGCFADGSLLILSHLRPNPRSTLSPDRAKVLDLVRTASRMGSDGTVLNLIGDLPAESGSFIFYEVANTVPHGDLLYVGNGQFPEIRVYNSKGALVRIIRWDQTRIPITDELLKKQVTRNFSTNAPSSQIEGALSHARATPQPSMVPAYFQIRVDAAGRIWIQDHPIEHAAPFPWTVLDSTGRALGRVIPPTIPGGRVSEIPTIGRDEAVVVWRDEELGFAHVSFHALQPVEK